MGIPFITKENAAELQKLSVAAKLMPYAEDSPVVNEAKESERFRMARIARVRNQIVRIDRQLAKETDAATLDKLASALNRLQEQEGWLAGRAKPKPSVTKPAPRGSFSAPRPADIEPESDPGGEPAE